MAANRNAQPPSEFTARLRKARKKVSTSFVQALNATGTSQAIAARSLRVTKRTIGTWARGRGPVSVERVLASRRLAKAFRVALCVHSHDDSVGCVARKRGRST